MLVDIKQRLAHGTRRWGWGRCQAWLGLMAGTALLAMAGPLWALSTEEAAHLLRRTGFSPSPAEIAQLEPLDFTQAVDLILADVRKEAHTPPPAWIAETETALQRELAAAPRDSEERRRLQREVRQQQNKRSQELREWWYREMQTTPTPFTERMTLFWHNHFTSSLQKVRTPQLIYRQNVLLRGKALGNLRELTLAIARDPAMLIYLDNTSNRVKAPNENFARELLELFTLGEGHYSEADVKQAARAFTGWHVNRREGKFQYVTKQHDSGEKTFLGHSGRLGGVEVIDIIFEQPQAATMIVEKLWTEFISPTPDPAEVERLAELFRRENYELRPLMRALLLSPAFRDPANRGTLVKSPVELTVGLARTFGLPKRSMSQAAATGRELGQDLFNPPNVKGWPGGEAWIDSTTLLARQRVLETALLGAEQADRLEEPTLMMQPMEAEAGDTMQPGSEMMAEGKTGSDTPGDVTLAHAGPWQRQQTAGPRARATRGGNGTAAVTEWAMRQARKGADAQQLQHLLLAVPPVLSDVEGDSAAEHVRRIVLDPAYQVK